MICKNWSIFFLFLLLIVCSLSMQSEALASSALGGGASGSDLPWEDGVNAIWNSIQNVVAPIAVAVGVVLGMILMARGSAGSAVYAMFGFAMIGGISLGIDRVFSTFGWSGALV